MARSPSAECWSHTESELLLDLAETALRARLAGRPVPDVGLDTLPDALHRPSGAFVTLLVDGRLNGCIGHIESDAPIAETVAELAVKAAFEDPRLPQLRRDELDRLTIEISLLSPPRPVPACTRAELLGRLVPGRHGLVLSSGRHRAVFLPTVWEQLPDPDEFVDHLLRKAGLPADVWPPDLVAELFTAEVVERELG